MLNILLVEDIPLWAKILKKNLQKHGDVIYASNAQEAKAYLNDYRFDLVFADLDLGENELDGAKIVKIAKRRNIYSIVLTTRSDEETIDYLLEECGADNYFTKPDEPSVMVAQIKDMIDAYKKKARDEEVQELIDKEMLTRSFQYRENLFKKIKRIDDKTKCVLVVGETGTGKTRLVKKVIAKLIDSDKEVLRIDCGAFSESLIDSELFGHCGGAYTGSSKQEKAGLFEQAEGKILFLDDIQNLTEKGQQNLRTIRDEGYYYPVGTEKKKKYFNSPIIFAGTEELDKKIEDKTFRNDVYGRISAIRIDSMPLRLRKKDIIPFIRKFAKEKYPNGMVFRVQKEAEEALLNYSWPMNTREVENAVLEWSTQGIQVLKIEDLDRRFVGEDKEEFALTPEQIKYLIENGSKATVNKMRRSIMKFITDEFESDKEAAKKFKIDRSVVYNYRKTFKSENVNAKILQ